MSILNQNLLTLDFWQNKVTYAGHTLPTGSIGCAAMNISDEQIGQLIQFAVPLAAVVELIAFDSGKEKCVADHADDAYHLSVFSVRLFHRWA